MVDKKQIMADLDKVGHLIAATKKRGSKLSAEQVRSAKKTLGTAAAELFRMRVAARKAGLSVAQKRAALNKSASESLISKADLSLETRKIATASIENRKVLASILASIDAVKKLAAQINTLAAAPELEKLEKGHTSSDAIKEPASASASLKQRMALRSKIQARLALKKKATETPKDMLMGEGKIAPELKVDELGMKAPDSDPISQGNAAVLSEGSPAESTKKGDATGDAQSETMVTARKRAANLFRRAMLLVRQANSEKDATKRTATLKQAAILEKMADRLVAAKPAVRATVKPAVATKAPVKAERKPVDPKVLAAVKERIAAKRVKASSDKAAAMPVLAANDRVLLADGSIGVVKTCSGSDLVVTIAGVDKPVVATTVKKISSAPVQIAKASEAPKIGSSIMDRVSAAINMVRGSKKVKANDEPEPAAVPGADMADTSADANKVSTSETSSVVQGPNGKWLVNVSEVEVLEFEDEASAKAHLASVKKADWTPSPKEDEYFAKKEVERRKDKGTTDMTTDASKKAVAGQDDILDSANTATPASQENVQTNLKGLDQGGKDGGASTADQKVDEQFSMVASKKTGTAKTKDAPVDSATTATPAGSESIVSKIKGLTQQSMGYDSTKKNQQMDAQLGPLVQANKVMASRLAIAESKLLVDRAIKVGALAEAQRSAQEGVLAELHRNGPSEFKAFARLIDSMEATSSPVSLAARGTRKVEASLLAKKSTVIDSQISATAGKTGSLDEGNFFDEN